MPIQFDEAIKEAGEIRSLLVGNGFSIAQAGAQFAYSTLLEKANLPAAGDIRNVFTSFETSDFELVMHALEHAARVEDAYNDQAKATQFRTDATTVRDALIHAVKEVHPGVSFDIPKAQRDSCGAFLRKFRSIFTINYDLLLYWVVLKMGGNTFTDGFGLGQESNGFRTFSEEGMCNTYYLHGALHLFLGEDRGTLKRVVTSGTIIDDIAATIRKLNQLPLFVAEGSAIQKMARINSVPYLRSAYDELKQLSGSLFVYGHSVAENDYHLYNAIFGSKIKNLFVCVYEPDKNLQGIRERLAQFCARNGDTSVQYIDSATVEIW